MEAVEESKIEGNNIGKSKEKMKRPRTEKQMEAFKKCMEKRKQKLEERKNNTPPVQSQQQTHDHNLYIPVKDNVIYKNLIEQIETLKNQVGGISKHMETTNVNNITNRDPPKQQQQQQFHIHNKMDNLNNLNQSDKYNDFEMEIEPPQPTAAMPLPMQAPMSHEYNNYNNFNYNVQSRQNMMRQNLGYNINSHVQQNSNQNRKRDIRGMDPYADEKQGMMEKIYTRSTNQYKQQQLELQRQNAMSDENSIQILNQAHQNRNENFTDRSAPVENMTNMIRSTSITPQARRQSAIAFNGLRVASRFR